MVLLAQSDTALIWKRDAREKYTQAILDMQIDCERTGNYFS